MLATFVRAAGVGTADVSIITLQRKA